MEVVSMGSEATPRVRIRIGLQAGELEIEGPEEFVDRYKDTIEALLDRARTSPVTAVRADKEASGRPLPNGGGTNSDLEFPETLHGLSNNASDTDRILLAGWWASKASNDGTFVTGDANRLLVGQGVKVSNPSQCVLNSLKAKRVFKVGNRYKVSKTGETYLASLVPGLSV
jgi:hypothetical protein